MKERLPRPLSNKERRKLARQGSQPPPKDGKFRLDRRHVIGGAAGLAIIAGAVVLGADLLVDKSDEEQTFSGEVDETRNYLLEWNNDLKINPDKFEEYLPRIKELSIAYFVGQMSNLFPERRKDYQAKNFRDNIFFVSEQDFIAKIKKLTCNGKVAPHGAAITVATDNKTYLNKDAIGKVAKSNNNELALVPFGVILHELHHLYPELKKIDESWSTKGLIAIVKQDKKNTEQENCLDHYNENIEEAVVEDSTERLLQKLGFGFTITDYNGLVSHYRKFVIDDLYKGEYKELLGYQQETKANLFFESIGKKLGIQGSNEDQRQIGNDFVNQFVLP